MLVRSRLAALWAAAALLGCDGSTNDRAAADAAANDDRMVALDTGAPDGGTDDTGAPGDAAIPCTGQPGTFHDQPVEAGGETRHYFLYVPAAYQCGAAWPLLVDFHGTAGGTEADLPEEYYALDGMLQVADEEGFIVARPRSRFAVYGGQQIYQWDINSGDLARNAALARALLAKLAADYHIDPSRVYAAGFSNGTNMAMQLLTDPPRAFVGYAVIGGGLWNAPHLVGDLATGGPRIYATSGYRDYMFAYERELLAFLEGQHLPGEQVFKRETDNGHELYGWHYRELWRWLDRGERPAAGTLAAGWQRELLDTTDSLIELGRAGDGAMIAAATGGRLWRRAPTGEWSQVGSITGDFAPNLTGLCFQSSGVGLAVGEGQVARTTDHGLTWASAPVVPKFSSDWFDYSYLNAVTCTDGLIIGGGYQAGVVSSDGGATWSEAAIPSYGYPAQIAGLGVSASGTFMAAGYYDYVARSADGHTFVESPHAVSRQWWNKPAPTENGRWVVVGESGSILLSVDDGRSFSAAASPTDEDLYAVAFGDATHALAVGAHGIALLSCDGGGTWREVATGLDAYLGDVGWLTPTTALVAGEHGTAFTFTVTATACGP